MLHLISGISQTKAPLLTLGHSWSHKAPLLHTYNFGLSSLCSCHFSTCQHYSVDSLLPSNSLNIFYTYFIVISSSKPYNLLDFSCGLHLVVDQVVIYFINSQDRQLFHQVYAQHSVPQSPLSFHVCLQGVLSSSSCRVILS